MGRTDRCDPAQRDEATAQPIHLPPTSRFRGTMAGRPTTIQERPGRFAKFQVTSIKSQEPSARQNCAPGVDVVDALHARSAREVPCAKYQEPVSTPPTFILTLVLLLVLLLVLVLALLLVPECKFPDTPARVPASALSSNSLRARARHAPSMRLFGARAKSRCAPVFSSGGVVPRYGAAGKKGCEGRSEGGDVLRQSASQAFLATVQPSIQVRFIPGAPGATYYDVCGSDGEDEWSTLQKRGVLPKGRIGHTPPPPSKSHRAQSSCITSPSASALLRCVRTRHRSTASWRATATTARLRARFPLASRRRRSGA